MDCTIVDVFAERPLTGNQLAVIRGCAHLDSEAMQAIAREMNFSETTFVMEERSGEARVRIFTKDRELPFAGHPTLGTAWVLGRDRDCYTLELAAGRVPVTFEDGIAWMEPPPVSMGDLLDGPRAAALLGLDESEIDSRYPCRFITIGPWFLLVGVRTLDALRRVAIDPAVYDDVASGGWLSLFVFTEEAYNEDADIAARMLTFHGTLHEDPATGSANTAFAAHLRSLGRSGCGRRGAGVRDRSPVAALPRDWGADPGRRQGAPGADGDAGTVVDAEGLPLRFALSPGQAHDSTLAGALLDDRLPPDSFVLADKAYDAEWIRAMIEAQDAVPIIPDRSSAKTPHAFSRDLYRLRNRVERFFNKLKQFRRIATRYEKLAANYLAMIQIATIRIWLRSNESTP